ncbi:MAG: hypothetical protein AVDCRST_MAG18-2880, partial [uncultured Thermomicrobiales bacterium]
GDLYLAGRLHRDFAGDPARPADRSGNAGSGARHRRDVADGGHPGNDRGTTRPPPRSGLRGPQLLLRPSAGDHRRDRAESLADGARHYRRGLAAEPCDSAQDKAAPRGPAGHEASPRRL